MAAPGYKETITLETMNPIIQRGDKLAEQGRAEIGGTLGVVMKSKSAHFGLTAGHVIPNDTHVLDAHRSDGKVIIPLQVAKFSARIPLLEFSSDGEFTNFIDDCGFFPIPPAHSSSLRSRFRMLVLTITSNLRRQTLEIRRYVEKSEAHRVYENFSNP